MVIPRFKVPAVHVEAEPIERTVGDNEVTRRMQRPAGSLPVDNIQHARMADSGNELATVVACHVVDGGGNSFGMLQHTFTGFKIVVGISRNVMRIGVGIFLLALYRSDALKDAVMTLAQFWQGLYLEIAARGQHLRGFVRAYQVTAVDRTEVVMCRVEGHRQCLLVAGVVERNVGLSLNALADIPVSFAVAD